MTNPSDDPIPSLCNLQSNPIVAVGCHGADLWPDWVSIDRVKYNPSIAIEPDVDGMN
jgi:hypothetical protein